MQTSLCPSHDRRCDASGSFCIDCYYMISIDRHLLEQSGFTLPPCSTERTEDWSLIWTGLSKSYPSCLLHELVLSVSWFPGFPQNTGGPLETYPLRNSCSPQSEKHSIYLGFYLNFSCVLSFEDQNSVVYTNSFEGLWNLSLILCPLSSIHQDRIYKCKRFVYGHHSGKDKGRVFIRYCMGLSWCRTFR